MGIATKNHSKYVLRIACSDEVFLESKPASKPPTTLAAPIAPNIQAVI